MIFRCQTNISVQHTSVATTCSDLDTCTGLSKGEEDGLSGSKGVDCSIVVVLEELDYIVVGNGGFVFSVRISKWAVAIDFLIRNCDVYLWDSGKDLDGN